MTNDCEINENLRAKDPVLPDLSTELQQLRDRYEEQQRRLSCPSCGEEPFID
jgi:hypothetical protein